MTVSTLSGRATGFADDRLSAIVERLDAMLESDSDLSFQAAAYHDGALVLDATGGPHLRPDSVMVPFSVTKNTIGLTVGLLVQRGLLDLDAPVADSWPEFAAKGKGHITVRQLLSHQAGLPQAVPALAWDELLDHHAAADRLAQTRPFWQPGSAFGYHALTIGNLASEVVFRVTGATLHEYYEEHVRRPLGADFYLGLPPEHEHRFSPVLPMNRPSTTTVTVHGSLLLPVVMAQSGPPMDLGNDPRSRAFGHPAGSGTGTARGIARLLAGAVTGADGTPALLTTDTVEIIGQQQVRGYDEVLGQQGRSHSIVFQKPTAAMPFGGPRAFGHDGAMGAFASVDPDTGVAFAYTIARGPFPGGGDARAVSLAAELGVLLTSS